MVIRAENTRFEKEFSQSGGPDGVNLGGIPVKASSQEAATSPPKAAPAVELEGEVKEDSLAELQQAMNLVADYAGKGTPLGVQSLQIVLLKAAASLYSGVTEERLGAALAAVVLLAQERGISIEKVAHDKITKMVTG